MADFDIVIKNGSVIDGTGAPAFTADIGIAADRIERIGDLSRSSAVLAIDAAGKAVAPGFVDVHNHSDAWLLKIPHLLPKTRQGFTTEVIMADGISYAPVDDTTSAEWIFYMRSLNGLLFEEYKGWRSVADYMDRLDGRCVQNATTHIPYANLRAKICGFGRLAPDDFQMRLIIEEVEKEMDAGAVGLSTGLDYIAQCFATTDELVEVASAMSAQKGLYVTHVRYKKGTLEGIREAVEIGRRANVPVHISHMKGTTPKEIDTVLDYVDRSARQEVDFSFDVYPYLPGSTMLNFLLPFEVWENGPIAAMTRLTDPHVRRQFDRELANTKLDRAYIAWLPGKENSRHVGKTLAAYLDEVGGARSPADTLCDLLIEENLAVLLVFHHGDDALVHPFLAHDCYMMGTDGIYFPDSAVHPRMYGSAPRLLGPCVRDHRLFSLEAAVRKLSGYPAERFGLGQRGRIEAGYFADFVIFDPETVSDQATFEDPHQYPVGIDDVIVNGVAVIRQGQEVEGLPDPLPGRWLKYHR
jgi:N-acyl-D-amino-acid deacylase